MAFGREGSSPSLGTMRLFVTGFGPFGPVSENPSDSLAQGCGLPHQTLEVSFQAVERFLKREFRRRQFDGLLLLGVSPKADSMRLESRGVNACGPHPDVRNKIGPKVISPQGTQTRRSTLWRPNTYELDGFTRSTSAGRYLCNYALYRALEELPHHRVGFLHVPPFETVPQREQAARLNRLLKSLIATDG